MFAIDNKLKLEFISDEFEDSDDLFLNRAACSYVSSTVGKLSSSGTADLVVARV